MKLKNFLLYVEIQTKITSLMTFTLVMLVLNYHGVEINVLATSIFFLSMFIFDLTTTAINNYIDSKSNDEDFGFSRETLKIMLFTMLAISAALGLYLVYLTDWIVLILGMFSFAVGICYTYGPIAISRQPYGEIISGVLYGYVIPFILFYINLGDKFLNVDIGETINIVINTKMMIQFLIFGIVPTLITAAIMLGNNVCDVERDVLVNRFTLPFYIGKDNALKLLVGLYATVFVAIIVGVLSGLYPLIMLAVLLISPIVIKNAKSLGIEFSKERSFVYVIKNFIMISMSMILVMVIANII